MSQFAAAAVTPQGIRKGAFMQDGTPDWGAMDYVSDAALAVPRGLLGGASDIVNLVGLPFGEQVVDDRFGLMGESESMVGGFIEGAASFSTGFALGNVLGVGAKLSKVSGLARAVASAGTWVDDAARVAKFAGNVAKADRYARYGKAIGKVGQFVEHGVFNSAFADFVSFDGNEQRLSNLVQSFPMLQNPITEYLAASPDDGEIEGRLKNAIEGLFITGATEGLFNFIRVTRAGAKARSLGLDADRAVAEEYGKIRVEQRDLLKAAAPQFNDAQLDMSNLLIDKMGVDRRSLVLAGNDVATQVAVAAGADPRNKKGLTDFLEDGKALVALFNKADVSTVLHEMAHVARRQLLDRGVDPAISGVSDMELRMLEEWAGARDGVWSVEADEKYATGVERYILDGNAPPGMERTFRKLTNWMRNIYRDVSVTQVGQDAPKEIRQIMSKLLDQGPGIDPKMARAMEGRAEAGGGVVFQTAPAPRTKEFKEWFGDSAVRTPEGKPLVVEHKTDADFTEFKAGEFGFHVGTGIPDNMLGSKRMRLYASIKNPIRMKDLGVFNADRIYEALGSRDFSFVRDTDEMYFSLEGQDGLGTKFDAELDEAYKASKELEAKLGDPDIFSTDPRWFDFKRGQYEATAPLRELLKKYGIDGIVYKNESEGFNDSWIAFDPQQLKSVDNRRPTSNPDIRFQTAPNPDLMLGTFYSKLQRTLTESKQRKMSTQQLKGMLTTAGIKQEELYWTGMEDVLKKGGSVDLDEVMRQIQPVEIAEVRRGPGERQTAKWATYSGERLVIPGGKNERELTLSIVSGRADQVPISPDEWSPALESFLGATRIISYKHPAIEGTEVLEHIDMRPGSTGTRQFSVQTGVGRSERFETLEEAKAAASRLHSEVRWKRDRFRGPHWDEDNVLVHVRMNDRTGPNGEKVLFIEEVQSDWHQQGRERGYKGQPATEEQVLEAADKVFGKNSGVVERLGWKKLATAAIDRDSAEELFKNGGMTLGQMESFIFSLKVKSTKNVPDAPFKSSDAWTGLAMKRMVAWAVENGYDGIAWTTGKQQADRYNKMLEDVRSISVSRTNSIYNIDFVRTDGTRHSALAHDDTELKSILGDSMAAKAISDLSEGKSESEFEGDSITIGDGAGYKVHYETIVPNQLKQIGKKFGAKVETLRMGDAGEAKTVEASAAVELKHVDQPAGEYDNSYRTNFSRYEPIDTDVGNNATEMQAMLDTYLHLADVKNSGGEWVNKKGIPQGIRDFKRWAQNKDLKVSEIRFKDVRNNEGATVNVVAMLVELTRNGQRERWVHRPYAEVEGAGFDWLYPKGYSDTDFVFQVKDMDEATALLKKTAVEEGIDFSYGQAFGLGDQPYFAFTQPLKDSVSKNGLPLFQSAFAPEPPFSRVNVAPDLGKPGGDPDAPMNWGNLTDVEQAARAMADARPEIPYRSMTREDFMARATEQANALEGILERSSLDDMRRAIAGGHLTDHDLQQFLEFAEGVRITASRFMSDLYNSARQLNVAGGDDIALARFAALESRTDLLISAAKQNQADIARALNFTGTVINPRYNRNPRVLPMLPMPGPQAATPPAAAMPSPVTAAPSPATAVPDPAAAATPSAVPDPAMATPAPAAAPAPAEMPDARLLEDPAVAASIAREIIEIAGGAEAIRDRIRRIVEAGTEDPMRALQVARESRRGNLLIEYWMNSILSGPVTHMVNITANTLTAVYLPLERALGAAIGGDQQTAQEAMRQLGYVMSQFRDAFALARQSFREDQSILDNVGTRDDNLRAISGESMRQGRMTRYVAPAEGSRAEGWLDNIGRIINLPTRMLAAEDEFFKQLNYRAAYRSELMAESMRRYPQLPGVAAQWVEETFNRTIVDGQQYAQNVVLGRAQRAANAAVAAGEITRGNVPNYVARYMADANNWNPQLGALSRRALEFARYATFQTPLEAGPNSPYLTRFGYHLQRASESVPGLRLIFPFIRTPTNLINFAVRRTIPGMMPNALELMRITAREAADPRMRADLQGRMAFAAGSTALISMYAVSGQISGNGPKNKEERRALEQAGWQPYSIRVGDTWVSYRRLDPFSTLIGLIADFAESYKYDELRQTDEELNSGVAALVMSVSRNVVNKSYLTGLTNVVNALGNPEQFSQTLLNNYAGSMVPFSGAMGQSKVGIADDAVMREVRTMLDAVQNKIPGLAENLPPQRNILGEPITRPRAGFEGVGRVIDLVSPFTYTQVKDDRILQEFALVGHGFAPPRETRGAIDLTAFATPSGQQAYDRWMELHGQVKIGGKTLRQALNKLIADPGYQKLSPIPSEDYDSPRVRRLRSVISMYREAAYRQLLKESPELAEAEGIEQSNRRSLRAGASMSQLQALVR